MQKVFFENPLHPYTKALLASAPDPYVVRGKRNILRGEQPVRTGEMKGCAFCGRCPYAEEICKEKAPEMERGTERASSGVSSGGSEVDFV